MPPQNHTANCRCRSRRLNTPTPYPVMNFDLSRLNGISDRTLEMHIKLYEGYVAQTNRLMDKLANLLRDGKVAQQDLPAYSELKRHLGFEYNGMILHELYFGNLKRDGGGLPDEDSMFYRSVIADFGSFDSWKADFCLVGNMRGIGWAICYLDPHSGRLTNHWIASHEIGNIAGFFPMLVMDVWEHAYLLDYRPAERARYIDAFFSNVNWQAVEYRFSLR